MQHALLNRGDDHFTLRVARLVRLEEPKLVVTMDGRGRESSSLGIEAAALSAENWSLQLGLHVVADTLVSEMLSATCSYTNARLTCGHALQTLGHDLARCVPQQGLCGYESVIRGVFAGRIASVVCSRRWSGASDLVGGQPVLLSWRAPPGAAARSEDAPSIHLSSTCHMTWRISLT